MRFRSPMIVFSLAVALILAGAARAQSLADRVPSDAILYIGWRGSSNLGPAYAQSHLKSVLEASRFPELLDQLLPNLSKRVRLEDPKAADQVDLVAAIIKPLRQYPSALYFGGVDTSIPDAPQVKLALLCDAGNDAQALLASLQQAIAQAKDVQLPLSATTYGNLVVVTSFAFAEKPDTPLSQDKDFAAAIDKVGKDAVATLYINNEKLLDLVDLVINAGGNRDAQETWPKVREALSLDGIKRLAFASGFDGQDWASTLWVEAPAPRKGLLGALEGAPIDDSALQLVPKDASYVKISQFDVGKLLAEARDTLKKLDPEASAQFEKGLSAASMFLGANVQTDLLDPLGAQWTSYTAKSVAGDELLGMVVINHLDDPAKAQRSLGLLEIAINNTLAGQRHKPQDPVIRFQSASIDDLDVHYLAIPFITPAWCVKDGNLYIGLFPQTVVAAATRKGGGSLLESEGFIAMRKRLGMEKAQGLTYLDLPATASQGYSSILMGSRVLLGMGDLFGVPSPAMVVPTFDALRPHFAPAGSVTRFDDGGMLFRHVTPFPGADLFGVQGQAMLGQSMASNAMMISILLPSLNRARETANRVKSASNLRQMGQGILLYSNENRGKYPPDAATLRKYMADLLSEQEVTQVFDSPLGRGPGGEDYVYLYFDGMNNSLPAEVIVAYDAAALNRPEGRDGTNVLFGDGHVEWAHPDTLRRAIERSRQLEPKSVPQDIPIPGAGPGAGPRGPSARPRPIPPRPPAQHPARSRGQ